MQRDRCPSGHVLLGRLGAARGSWKGSQVHCFSTPSPTAGFCMNQGLSNPAACLFVPLLTFEPIISSLSLIWQRFSKVFDTHKSHKNGQLSRGEM